MSNPHDGFLVKEHKPHHFWLNIAIVILLLIVAFFIGRWDRQSDLSESFEMNQELYVEIEQAKVQNVELVQANARLLSDSKVDRDTYESANESLISFQKEIRLLKEELVFYRGIVSPSTVKYGVKIQEFSLSQSGTKNRFQFKTVLTKQGKSKYSIRGVLNLSVKGLVDGKTKEFNFNEISEEELKSLKYSFKYFQIFEGFISLPEGFFPEQVKIRVKSKTKKVKSLEKNINWAELTPGEV